MGSWRKPTTADVEAVLEDWGGIAEVAQRLGTHRYGTVTRILREMYARGLTEDRWVEGPKPHLPRRQYRMVQRG